MKKKLKNASVNYNPVPLGANGQPDFSNVPFGGFLHPKGTIVETIGDEKIGGFGIVPEKYFDTDKGKFLSANLEDYTPFVDQEKSADRMAWIVITFFVILFIFAWVLIIRKK